MNFTLVSTIFNEAKRLAQTISDLEAQTISPTEIVITDAGSNDGSWDILQAWKKSSVIPIVLLQENRCNVARGRNLAIAAAKYDVIVSTDFGCRFHPRWLEDLTKPFIDESVEVVGGTFTVIEEDIKTTASRSDYILQNGYPIVIDDNFSVSSRSIAYRKYVWQTIQGYPEWLTLAADDTIFWRQIKANKYKYVFVQYPYVYWLRHNTNKAFAKEAFRYGLGDGESKINYRNFWSNLIETSLRYMFFSLFIAIVLLIGFGPIPVWTIVFLVPFLIGLRSYKRVIVQWWQLKSEKYNVSVLLNAFIQLELSRIQYIKGYKKGYTSKRKAVIDGRKTLSVR